jgi:type II secretory pathway pseudopilin PulG
MGGSMRSGSGAVGSQRGFAYILLLVTIAVIGVAAAGAVSLGSTMARRDAEEQLLAIGAEFERALYSYAGMPQGLPAGPVPPNVRGPRELEELLKDPRVPGIRRHLRQVYADPLTGKAEWGLVRDSQGFITGVYSLAEGRPIKASEWPERWRRFGGQEDYRGWVFGFDLNAPPSR